MLYFPCMKFFPLQRDKNLCNCSSPNGTWDEFNETGFTPYRNELPLVSFFFLWRCDPMRVMASSFLRFLDQTQQRTTVGRTPLDEWSARRRDLYLTTHDTHNRQHIHAPGGIRTHDLSRQAAADLRLRPRGHWDRLSQPFIGNKKRLKAKRL